MAGPARWRAASGSLTPTTGPPVVDLRPVDERDVAAVRAGDEVARARRCGGTPTGRGRARGPRSPGRPRRGRRAVRAERPRDRLVRARIRREQLAELARAAAAARSPAGRVDHVVLAVEVVEREARRDRLHVERLRDRRRVRLAGLAARFGAGDVLGARRAAAGSPVSVASSTQSAQITRSAPVAASRTVTARRGRRRRQRASRDVPEQHAEPPAARCGASIASITASATRGSWPAR